MFPTIGSAVREMRLVNRPITTYGSTMQSPVNHIVRNRRFWIGLAATGALAALVVSGFTGCGHNATAKGNAGQPPEPLAVVVVTPEIRTIHRTIVQPGYIRSYEETPIYSKLAGFLRDVYVDIGDKVDKGQLLGKLWVPEVEQEVNVKSAKILQAKADVKQSKEAKAAAEANVKTLEAMVEEAKAGVNSAEALTKRWENEYTLDMEYVKKGVLDTQTADVAWNYFKAAQAAENEAKAKLTAAKSSLKESQSKRDKAEADVEVSDAQLHVWEREYKEQVEWFKYARIEAPYKGIVTCRNVHSDHFVQPSNSGTTSKGAEPLFMFMRTDIVRIIVQVPESDAPLVKDQADAIVRIPALRNRTIHCKVTRNSGSLDTQSRTLRVEIFLDNPLTNPNEELKSGMYVNVSIMADFPNALSVPVDTIIVDGTQTYCFMVEDGKAKRVNVKTGMQNERWIQLLAKQTSLNKDGEPEWGPFNGSEKIIMSSLTTIRDDQPVAIKTGP